MDPFGGGGGLTDVSGPGLDPGLYQVLSQGGRFPGDTQNYLGFAGGPPGGYPAGTGGSISTGQNPNAFRMLLAAAFGGAPGAGAALATYLAQNYGSAGNIPTNPLSGSPNSFWSGPGAAFGPTGNPLGGLGDQGNPHSLDASDRGIGGGLADSRPGSGGKPPIGHHGGGGGGGAYHFTAVPPVGGKPYQAEFVSWQPIEPGTPGPYPPTQWTPGKAGMAPSTGGPQAKPPKGAKGPQEPGGAGGGGKPGTGSGAPGGIGPTDGKPGTTTAGDGNPPGPQQLGRQIQAGLGDPTFTGYNIGNQDRGPGGDYRGGAADNINNTSGMPGPTLPQPTSGESVTQYTEQLRQMGIPDDAIAGLLGHEGFQVQGGVAGGGGVPTMTGAFGWGTGPVVLGPGGYSFANAGNAAYDWGGGGRPNGADVLAGLGGAPGGRDAMSDIFHGAAAI